ncbi:MAG: hypothetical protein ACK59B_04810, partial [Alphaproteobacteria bacterium]
EARRMTAGQAAATSLLVPEPRVEPMVEFLRARAPAVRFTLDKPAQVFAPGNALAERLDAALAAAP